MKNIILPGIFMAFAFFATAQQDSKAKQILDEVSKKTRSHNTIAVDFVFSLENDEMDIHEQNQGTLQLKGQKYIVELPDLGVQVYSDGETLWNYMKDGNQVTISYLEESSSELMDPSTVFTIYEKGFRSEYVGEKKEGNKSFHQIQLYPDSGEYEVEKILLLIDKADNMIKSARLFDIDGNVYSVVVKAMRTGMELSDTRFVFNPKEYKDIEVIDFR